MKTIWNKQTGEAKAYEAVDAREILANSPDIYTDQDPKGGDPKDPDKDGFEGAPQNVANVENEFRREPVGDDPPAKERDEVIIRNPVTDQPVMAEPAAHDGAKVEIDPKWADLHWQKQVKLAGDISGKSDLSAAEARTIIADEVKRRG